MRCGFFYFLKRIVVSDDFVDLIADSLYWLCKIALCELHFFFFTVFIPITCEKRYTDGDEAVSAFPSVHINDKISSQQGNLQDHDNGQHLISR